MQLNDRKLEGKSVSFAQIGLPNSRTHADRRKDN